ncbi:MAG TPA: OmpA family protein, partial [Chitinophagales bacterium]|nr:OmpA family protein [Chitinophagales bacterium]
TCFTSAVTLTDVATGEAKTISPNMNGELHLDLKMNAKYTVNYNGQVDTLNTKGIRPGAIIDGYCKYRVGQKWLVPNVYYDLNKWNIRKDASAELNKLVKIMKENPTLQIELSSHTDCRSSARYNIVLSARRAKAVVDYLASHGVKMRRILAAGYGESMPTNSCVCEPSDYSPCDEKQHQANRRTEVKVLKY